MQTPFSSTGGRCGTSEGVAVVAGQAASGGDEAADGGEGAAQLLVRVGGAATGGLAGQALAN